MNTSINLTAFNKLSAKVESDYVFITLNDVLDSLHFDVESKLKIGGDLFTFEDHYNPFYPDENDYCRLLLNGKEVFFSDKPHKHASWMNNDATRLYYFFDNYFKNGYRIVDTKSFNVEELLNRSSYSGKQAQAIGLELGLDKDELDRQIINLNKSNIGKEGVVDLLLQVAITIYADELGIYAPDQLIKDIEKYTMTPTYNGEKLSAVLKHVWSNVSPALHTHPKGHKLIKALIIHLQKELGSKVSTGNKQMRTCIKMKALELFKDFN